MDKLKQKYNIISLNFADAKPPVIKEEKNKDYVCFGTDRDYRNNYPQYLLDLYQRSAKHAALVDGKVDLSMAEVGQLMNQLLSPINQWHKQSYLLPHRIRMKH